MNKWILFPAAAILPLLFSCGQPRTGAAPLPSGQAEVAASGSESLAESPSVPIGQTPDAPTEEAPVVARAANTGVAAQPASEESEVSFVLGPLRFDKLVHYFGDILVTDGPQSCRFTVENISEEAAAIYEVVSSCGCTGVNWTRNPLRPGEKGVIEATYDNEAGALPFDKTLSVYVSGLSRPVVLHLRGIVHEKARPLSELYPIHARGLGLRETQLKAGNLQQGETVGDETTVANLSSTPIRVSFSDCSPGLSLSVSPNPIPAGSTARLRYQVSAQEDVWGKNYYQATLMVNGQKSDVALNVFAYTKANFDSWSEEQREQAALPVFESSNQYVGDIRRGDAVEVFYRFSNDGKRPFVIYKVDADQTGVSSTYPEEVAPHQKGALKILFDSREAPLGETLIIISLTTNSPLRPIVNLFLSGNIVE